MMKATAEKISAVYGVLANAKLTELDTKGKIAVIKIGNKLKAIATQFNDFRDESMKRLAPEGFLEMAMKVQSGIAVPPSDLFLYNKIDKELAECLEEERKKEHDLDFEPLKNEWMEKLIDSNDFTVSQCILLEEVIG